ncbi:flavin reductase family protein [Streptomyces sp. NPDC088747]|uniref:flavin reductase family protein n=1 Tax=Streptomyces sp. NPDC088747 TaxID=3365886 RepID=UPI003829D9B9
MSTVVPDVLAFKETLSTFCSGVVVVTGLDGAEPVGMTCQSFTSLSLDPPLVSFAAARTSTSWPRIRRGGAFAVSILAADQAAVSASFAASGADKFARHPWHPGATGPPLIDGALAHVECALTVVHDAGDHQLVVGRVLALSTRKDATDPLLFFRSSYRYLR